MRMTIVFVAALAMLCGIPLGIIIGIFACYVAWSRQENDSADPDYSGGI